MLTRSSVPSNLHPAVDAVLKQLKNSIKRLKALLSTHQTELTILDRLHYKGRNQHRTALFWRRVNELRRYSRRVENSGITSNHENLRDSFYGNEKVVNTKVLRGAWTHLPPHELAVSTKSRLAECLVLVNKANERYLETYRFFMLQMQNGAFLQLILTLVAINSRLAVLMKEIGSTISNTLTTIDSLISIISETATRQKGTNNLPKGIEEINVQEISKSEIVAEDDLGLVSVDQHQSSIVVRLEAEKECSQPDDSLKPDIPPPAKKKRSKAEKASEGTKKKKKRDAIDDIFGF